MTWDESRHHLKTGAASPEDRAKYLADHAVEWGKQDGVRAILDFVEAEARRAFREATGAVHVGGDVSSNLHEYRVLAKLSADLRSSFAIIEDLDAFLDRQADLNESDREGMRNYVLGNGLAALMHTDEMNQRPFGSRTQDRQP